MSDTLLNHSALPAFSIGAVTGARPRRALIIADGTAARLQPHLAASGYQTATASLADAVRHIKDFAPDVAVIELDGVAERAGTDTGTTQEDGGVALARKLRADASTYALPLVFAWSVDEAGTRNAALRIGVDDYFALATPTAEILARLDALFWRAEAGRRAAPLVGDQRGEIDNFMLMLDAVRNDVASGASGTIALVYAAARAGEQQTFDKAARDRTLHEAHGFLKLNLRRVDAVAFYGPTTLFVYLPRLNTRAALAALTRLRGEFLDQRAIGGDILIGLASFPEDGEDLETLIEKAEAAANAARSSAVTSREARGLRPATTPRVIAAREVEQANDTAPTIEQLPREAAPQSAPTFTPAPQTVMTHPPVSTLPHKADAPQVSEEFVSRPAQAAPAEAPRNGSSRPARESKVAETVEANVVMPVHGDENHNRIQVGGANAARLASEAAARERERRSSGAVMPRRLLLTVSDPARMAQLNSLIRSAGYEARAVFDGQQALDLLRIERPDLLVLDYDLHGIDGVEAIRRLHKQGGGRLRVPVLLLVPAHKAGVRSEAIKLGARSVVVTPYDPADLLDNVRTAGSLE